MYVEYETDLLRVDRFGRTLGYLYRAPDGLFVNLEIVRQGYGHAYVQFPFEHMDLFRAYERRAREGRKGLWGPRAEKPKAPVAPAPAPAQPTVRPVPKPAPRPVAPIARPRITRPPPRQEVPSITVYVTRTGAKYHRGGCRYLRRSSIPMSLSQARQRYSPCSVCGPPR